MQGTKPALVLVLRIVKDLGDATLGGLLGGLCGVYDLTGEDVRRRRRDDHDQGDDDFDCDG